MDSQQRKRGLSLVKKSSDKNVKRRKKEEFQPMVNPKNILMKQRCLKNRQATTARLRASTDHVNPIETIFQPQNDLHTADSTSTSKRVTDQQDFPQSDVMDTGKRAIRPFCAFERGSTPGTSNAAHIPTVGTIAKNVTDRSTLHPRHGFDIEKCVNHPLCAYEKGSTSGTLNEPHSQIFGSITKRVSRNVTFIYNMTMPSLLLCLLLYCPSAYLSVEDTRTSTSAAQLAKLINQRETKLSKRSPNDLTSLPSTFFFIQHYFVLMKCLLQRMDQDGNWKP